MLNQKTILIAGGSGMIGSRLKQLLESRNFKVLILTRSQNNSNPETVYWNPQNKEIDKRAILDVDAIINLAGENIASGRWTARRKRKIINSRIFATNLLFETLNSIDHKVKLFINASAIGIYGNTGEKIIHEDAPTAQDFLGLTCTRWENAAVQVEKLGIRTVIFRIGIVLANEGGMLPEVRLPMKFGIAPVFGSGEQYQSWIHIHDLCRIMLKAINDEKVSGVFNAVAPGPLSNANFMELLIQLTGKSYFKFKIPALIMKLLLGEQSKIVLEGSRVSSKKIENSGFIFSYPQAGNAIKNLLESEK